MPQCPVRPGLVIQGVVRIKDSMVNLGAGEWREVNWRQHTFVHVTFDMAMKKRISSCMKRIFVVESSSSDQVHSVIDIDIKAGLPFELWPEKVSKMS